VCLIILVGCADSGEKPLTQVFIAGFVIPGEVTEQDVVPVRFVWRGNGCIQSLEEVEVRQGEEGLDFRAWSDECTDCNCAAALFLASHSFTAGPYPAGAHAVRAWSGRGYCSSANPSIVLTDSLRVPSAGPPDTFSFDVFVVDCATGEPYPSAEVRIELWENAIQADTTLAGVANEEGRCSLEYAGAQGDTLRYYALMGTWELWFPEMKAVRGRPERITANVP
jgi:hypothetical protein